MRTTDKGLIRATNRKGVRSGKAGTEFSGTGRVLLRGKYVDEHEPDIRRRIENVAERQRAAGSEPIHCSIERDADGLLQVVTDSQELAHRIVRELRKAFHGSASFQWSDGDGRLQATWQRDV